MRVEAARGRREKSGNSILIDVKCGMYGRGDGHRVGGLENYIYSRQEIDMSYGSGSPHIHPTTTMVVQVFPPLVTTTLCRSGEEIFGLPLL